MRNDAEQPYPFSDLALARRLERTEGHSNAVFIEARARQMPESGARWIEVAGAYALYDGVTSPLTQTFALGLFAPVTPNDLERIEAFYQHYQAPVFHEVSPLADLSLLALLNERGYQPIEWTSILCRPVGPGIRLTTPSNERLRVRRIHPGEEERWARTAARGWSEFTEFADGMYDLALISARREGGLSFLAELDGQAIATAALFLQGGVALLAGASTIPEGRKQGAQLALLEARLRYAVEHGCDLAMMGALPGSASQRNAERQGFRIAYTRIKWRLAR